MNTAAFGNPKAGFMESVVTNFAGTMNITVWYPTSNSAKGPSAYNFDQPPGFLDPYLDEEWAQAGATRDAPIKGGKFPLIVTYPGGGGSETQNQYFPNAELLAADGHIVVTPGRNTQLFEEQGPLLTNLIDHMLDDHALRDSIDANKIGAKGLSFGGIGVASLAGGGVFGNPADTRVRAVIIDEGAGVCSATYCDTVTIPVLLRDGSPLPGIGDMAPEFAALANAYPRFLLTLNDVTHLSFATGFCGSVELWSQLSLLYQQYVLGGIVEPEPRNISYFFVSSPPSPPGNGDVAGNAASFIWNFDTFVGAGGTFGSAGDFCRTEYGGTAPADPAINGPILDELVMIETLYATDLGFWQTVFGNGKSKKNKLEKAIEKLDTVKSFVKVTE
jgi:hypothetical protein